MFFVNIERMTGATRSSDEYLSSRYVKMSTEDIMKERERIKIEKESTEKRKVVVIVDPYSSGKYLVDELKYRQWPMVSVQSSMELADFWLAQLVPDNFVENIVHDEDNFEGTL